MALKTAIRYNIFVIDHQPVIRGGLAYIMKDQEDLILCGEASDNAEALYQIRNLKPDLVIVEFSIDESNGLDFPKIFREQFPTIPLLIFTSLPESLYAERFLRAGVNGYVMKRESGKTILEAIRRILEGKTYVSPQLNERILKKLCDANQEQEMDAPVKDRLSVCEFRVFELVGQGYNTRKISEELNISMKTVEAHRLNIKRKLRLNNTVALVQRAIQWVHYEKNGLVNSLDK